VYPSVSPGHCCDVPLWVPCFLPRIFENLDFARTPPRDWSTLKIRCPHLTMRAPAKKKKNPPYDSHHRRSVTGCLQTCQAVNSTLPMREHCKLAYVDDHALWGHGQIRGSIVVSISACHAEDPGSIPGRGVFLFCHQGSQGRSYLNPPAQGKHMLPLVIRVVFVNTWWGCIVDVSFS
jgi:hypothetical protein